MNNTFLDLSADRQDPNQEVESWKDAYYDNFKTITKADLSSFLEKEADRILNTYGIKCRTIKIIKQDELVSA